MPTSEEVGVLESLEHTIANQIQTDDNAIFLARITCRSERVLLHRVRDPDAANDILHRLASDATQIREWDYQIQQD